MSLADLSRELQQRNREEEGRRQALDELYDNIEVDANGRPMFGIPYLSQTELFSLTPAEIAAMARNTDLLSAAGSWNIRTGYPVFHF